ncbi:MAG: NTP transferase domain-containing protein [Alphaproteobacteria bacterium]
MYKNHANLFVTDPVALNAMFEATHSAKRLLNGGADRLEDFINGSLELCTPNTFLGGKIGIELPKLQAMPVPTTALILAGGRGTRMGEITKNKPKSLIDVAGKPLVEYTTDLAHAAGFRRFLFNTSYLANKIKDYVSAHQASVWTPSGQRLITIDQDKIIDPTSSSFWSIAKTLFGRTPFLYANADNILLPLDEDTENPITRLVTAWREQQPDIAMLVCKKENAIGKEGSADYRIKDGSIIWCDRSDKSASHVFAGISLMTPQFARQYLKTLFRSNGNIDDDTRSKFESDTAHQAVGKLAEAETGIIPKSLAIVHDGLVYDVANPEMIKKAESAIESFKLG